MRFVAADEGLWRKNQQQPQKEKSSWPAWKKAAKAVVQSFRQIGGPTTAQVANSPSFFTKMWQPAGQSEGAVQKSLKLLVGSVSKMWNTGGASRNHLTPSQQEGWMARTKTAVSALASKLMGGKVISCCVTFALLKLTACALTKQTEANSDEDIERSTARQDSDEEFEAFKKEAASAKASISATEMSITHCAAHHAHAGDR